MQDLQDYVTRAGINLDTVRFNTYVQEGDYNIPLRVLVRRKGRGDGAGEMIVLSRLRAGWGFSPRVENAHAEIHVLRGSGEFTRGGQTSRYEPGAHLDIEPGVAHAFTRVDAETFFIKSVTRG